MKNLYLPFVLLVVVPASNTVAQYNLTVELASPTTGCMGSAEVVSLDVINTMTIPYAGTFDLSYSINGGDIVTATVTAFIPASGTYHYSFAPTSSFTHCQIHEVMVAVNDPNDINESNDTVVTEIINNCRPDFAAVGSIPVVNGGDGKLFCSVEGGIAPYFYVWTNQITLDTYCGQNWSGVGVGTYEIQVSDANDCKADSIVEVGTSALAFDDLSGSELNVFFSNGNLIVNDNNFENRIMTVFDSSGKLISSTALTDVRTEMALPDANGVYYYQMLTAQNDLICSGKFVAQ